MGKTLSDLMNDKSKKFPEYDRPSDVDKMLVAYLFDGYNVFSCDKHIINLAAEIYPLVKNKNPNKNPLIWYINKDFGLVTLSIRKKYNEDLLKLSSCNSCSRDKDHIMA